MRKIIFISMLLMAGYAGPVAAQQPSQSDEWKFRLTPYFVGTTMDGNLTINGRSAAVNVGFGDILENLEFGAMLHFLVEKGPWSIGLDGIYMGLGGSSDEPPAEASMDQWLVELTGAYQVKPWLQALAGARYNFLSGEIAFQGRQEREKSGNVDWIDPVIGARLAAPLAEKWTVRGRADIGGFGLSSNLTWQLAAYIDFRASNLISIIGGYRFLSNDYQTGSGDELFRYDMLIFGPALGVSFVF